MLIQMILYGLIGLLLIGLSFPLMRGKVPPTPGMAFASGSRWTTRRFGIR
jgi:hypothetical protein